MQTSRLLNFNRLSWLLKIGFVLLFIYFLSRANLGALLTQLRGLNVVPLLAALALLVPFVLAKALRWRIILQSMGVTAPSNWHLCIYYTIGLFLGGVTPGQFGDIAKGWYLRNHDVPLQTALLSVVMDRVCDLLLMAILGIIALLNFVDLIPPQLLVAAQVGTLALALGSALFVSQRFRSWLATLLDRTVLRRFNLAQMLDFRFTLLNRSFPMLFIFTVLSIGCNVLRNWLLFAALGISIPFFSIFAVITLIAIFQVLPVSIAGFGVRETLLIATLQQHGYSIEAALSLSLLLFLLNVQQIIIGFFVSLFYPVQMERQ